jgi:hypothetical protein
MATREYTRRRLNRERRELHTSGAYDNPVQRFEHQHPRRRRPLQARGETYRMSANSLDDLRNLQAARARRTPPKEPTTISWRSIINRSTGECTLVYDEELVDAAMKAPDDFIISEVGVVEFVGERLEPEPTFGDLIAAHS